MKLDWRSPYAKRTILTTIVVTLSIAALLLIYRILQDSGNILTQLSSFGASIASVLTPFLLAMLLAYILAPIVRFFEKRFFGLFLKKERFIKLRRGLSVLLTYLLLTLSFVWLGSTLWPVLWSNMQEFWKNFPSYLDTAQAFANTLIQEHPLLSQPNVAKSLQTVISNLELELDNIAAGALQFTINFIRGLSNSLTDTFIVLIAGVYFLLDGPRMLNSLHRLARAVLGETRTGRLRDLAQLFERMFGVYVRARLLESLVVFALVYLSFLIFRLPYSALFALVNAISNLIPYFGPIIGCVLTMGVLVMVDPMQALYAGILVTVVQQIENFILDPKLMGESLNLRPIYVILAVTAGGTFFGIPGMILTVPFVAFLGRLLSAFIERRIGAKETGVKQK